MSYWDFVKTEVRDRGPDPIVTWISNSSRIELSTITFANAMSKASNFLLDGLELDESSSISVNLGNHWQSPVWLGTGLATGIKILDASGSVTFGTLEAARFWTGPSESYAVISQDPFGMPDREIPAGLVNGSAEVRNFGDYFAPTWPHDSAAISAASNGTEFTWDQLVEYANIIADNHEIATGQRYGLKGESDLLTTLALQVVLPITNKNSVVLLDQVDPDFDAIKNQEKLDQFVVLSETA